MIGKDEIYQGDFMCAKCHTKHQVFFDPHGETFSVTDAYTESKILTNNKVRLSKAEREEIKEKNKKNKRKRKGGFFKES